METPQHLDPGLSEDERATHRAELRAEFTDLPFELKDVALNNYIDALHRLTGPTGRLSVGLREVVVEPVTPTDVDDVLAFFDHDAFAGKPEWAMCYCRFHHASQEPEWGERTWQQNRRELAEALRAGDMRGLVVRVEGRVVAWLNCSNRSTSPQHATGEDDGIACTFCWAIAPSHRGHGLARTLLEAATEHLADEGIHTVEGYAIEEPADDAAAYVGPLSLYRSCGFDVVDHTDKRVTVRRQL